MLYKEWVDFVTFPLDAEKCYSREQRLNLSEAVSVDSPDYTPELGTEKGVITPKQFIFFEDDEFEAMEITDYGHVFIWTDKKVWTLHNAGGLERLLYVPRHPNPEDYSHMNKPK